MSVGVGEWLLAEESGLGLGIYGSLRHLWLLSLDAWVPTPMPEGGFLPEGAASGRSGFSPTWSPAGQGRQVSLALG